MFVSILQKLQDLCRRIRRNNANEVLEICFSDDVVGDLLKKDRT